MERFAPIGLAIIVIFVLALLVGVFRGFRRAIGAYRAATSRGVSPMWAAGFAVVLGVSVILGATNALNFRTAKQPDAPPVMPRARLPRTAPLPPEPPKVLAMDLTVSTTPPGIEVTVDGAVIGVSPITHRLEFEPAERKRVRVEVRKPGFVGGSRSFQPSSSDPQTFDFQLTRNPNVALVRLISSPPDVELLLDRRRVGTEFELIPGAPSQTLLIRREGYVTEERSVSASGGLEQTLEVKLEKGAMIEVSCAACTGSVALGNSYLKLPTTLTVTPKSRQTVNVLLEGGRIVTRTVSAGAAGTVTRVSVD